MALVWLVESLFLVPPGLSRGHGGFVEGATTRVLALGIGSGGFLAVVSVSAGAVEVCRRRW